MPKHDVELKISHPVNIGNKDVEFPIKIDGKPLGKMLVSTGTVDWVPSPKSKSGFRLSWSEFNELMQKHGQPFK